MNRNASSILWKSKEAAGGFKDRLGRPLTCCINTFGCQMNARDSEKLLGILEAIGYVASDTEEADFVLYNTCTVRENANLRVYGRLGQLGAKKEKASPYDDRALRLYDAGKGSGRKDQEELPLCGSDLLGPTIFLSWQS